MSYDRDVEGNRDDDILPEKERMQVDRDRVVENGDDGGRGRDSSYRDRDRDRDRSWSPRDRDRDRSPPPPPPHSRRNRSRSRSRSPVRGSGERRASGSGYVEGGVRRSRSLSRDRDRYYRDDPYDDRGRGPPIRGGGYRGPPPPHHHYPPPPLPHHRHPHGPPPPHDWYPPPPPHYPPYPPVPPVPPPPPRGDYGRGGAPPPPPRGDRGPRRVRRDEGPPGVSLLVRNVSPAITSHDLHTAFGRIGEIRDVYIPKDYHSQQPKGFAFIEFASAERAREARDEMDRFVIKGRELEVVFAQERRKTPDEMRGRVVNMQNSESPGRGNGGGERSSSYERHKQRERDRGGGGGGGYGGYGDDYDRRRDRGERRSGSPRGPDS